MNTIKVKNIAELKTRKGTLESVVEVLGYYTEGDEGGGNFYWDNTSTETDNGGTIIQVNSLNTGRWKRIIEGVVTVKQFGAVNSGDSTSYIQKAIDYVGSIRGKLIINNGNYDVTQLLIPDKIEIEGESKFGTVLYQMATPSLKHLFILNNVNNDIVTIRNFTCIGNKEVQSFNNDCIHLDNTGGNLPVFQDALHDISDLVIIRFKGSGVYLGNEARESRLSNIFVDNCDGYGFYISTTDSKITNCTTGSSGLAGFYSRGNNNLFTSCKAFGGGSYGFLCEQSRNNFINCEAQDNFSHGYFLNGCDNTDFIGCIADSNAGGVVGGGFYCNNSNNIKIIANIYNREGSIYPTGQDYSVRVENNCNNIFIHSTSLLNSQIVDYSKVSIIENSNLNIASEVAFGVLKSRNTVSNKIISIYDEFGNAHQFYGFGLGGGELRLQVASLTHSFNFYAAASNSSSNKVFSVNGDYTTTYTPLTTSQINALTKVDGKCAYNGDTNKPVWCDGTIWRYADGTIM